MGALPDALWRIGLRVAYRILRVVWWLRRPVMHGAYVAVWRDDRLLLVRNSYRRSETVPCGAVGRSESPRQAAARELAEEVGMAVSEEELHFVCELEVDFESKRDRAHFFELRSRRELPVRIDNREVVWAGFVERADLSDRPLVPHVRGYLERIAGASGAPAKSAS